MSFVPGRRDKDGNLMKPTKADREYANRGRTRTPNVGRVKSPKTVEQRRKHLALAKKRAELAKKRAELANKRAAFEKRRKELERRKKNLELAKKDRGRNVKTPSVLRKNPMTKAPGSGTKVKRPANALRKKLSQQPNISAADMKNVKLLPSSKVRSSARPVGKNIMSKLRSQRSQTKKGRGL